VLPLYIPYFWSGSGKPLSKPLSKPLPSPLLQGEGSGIYFFIWRGFEFSPFRVKKVKHPLAYPWNVATIRAE